MPKKAGKQKVKKAAKKKSGKKLKKTVKRKAVRKPLPRSTRKKTVKKKPAKKTVARAKKAVKKKKPARKISGPVKKVPAKTLSASKSTRPRGRVVSPRVSLPSGQRLGFVTHYYNHLGVAIIKLDAGVLKVGDTIHLKGHTTDCFQEVESMQIEHSSVKRAVKGEEFGLKVPSQVREHDQVYRADRVV